MNSLVSLFDSEEPIRLAFAILLLLMVSGAVITPKCQEWALRLAAAAFCLYAATRWLQHANADAEDLFDILIRAALVAGFTLGVSRLGLPLTAVAYAYTLGALLQRLRNLYKWFQDHRRDAQAQREEVERLAEAARAEEAYRKSQPVPLTRAQRAKQRAAEVQRDFDVDCQLIRSLGLDADEEEFALLQASQRRLKRLKEIL